MFESQAVPAVRADGTILWVNPHTGDHEVSPRVHKICSIAGVAFLAAVFMLLALTFAGIVPAAPWSPVGKHNSVENVDNSTPSDEGTVSV